MIDNYVTRSFRILRLHYQPSKIVEFHNSFSIRYYSKHKQDKDFNDKLIYHNHYINEVMYRYVRRYYMRC